MSYLQKEVRSLFGKVIHFGRLIADGDHIAVGLSGGKDSMTLLWLLADRRRRTPIDFKVSAIWVDMHLPGFDGTALARMCDALDVELIRISADWDPEELGKCYLCARRRRLRLFDAAEELGGNVVALGHNLDDVIETFMMNMVMNGSASTMRADDDFFDGKFRVIRPLIRIPADKIRRFTRQLDLPVQEQVCGLADSTRRAAMREHLKAIYREHPKARENIFNALTRVDPGRMPEPLTSDGPVEHRPAVDAAPPPSDLKEDRSDAT